MDQALKSPTFQFQPRWKEELACTCELGSFVLMMPMGVVSVDFPTEETWQLEAPNWAKPYWEVVQTQLSAWCESQNIPLHMGPFGHVV